MKLLVTGARGQLGTDICRELTARGATFSGVDREELDITDGAAVMEFIREYKPDGVIHCAAYTAVDRAESEEELCRSVNAFGTRNIALACAGAGAKMIYISTDYVFDGQKDGAYCVGDIKNPRSVYGRTKSEGEEYVKSLLEKYFIVRISWVFGAAGNNFVKTMLRLAGSKNELNVVCDQHGSPTYTADLAPLLCDMIETDRYGTYHATNGGECSWHGFASEIFRLAGKDIKVNPVTTEEYARLVKGQAPRPLNSVMSKKSLTDNGFALLPDWRDALKRFLADLA